MIDAQAALTLALKTAVLCSPALVAPLAGMTVAVDEGQEPTLLVESGGFTVGRGFAGMTPQERATTVMRGLLHVVLGHPAAMRAARVADGPGGAAAFARNLGVEVDGIIHDSPRLPNGMFELPTDPLPGSGAEILPAPSGDGRHAAIVDLMADSSPRGDDLVAVAMRHLGLELPVDARVDATGWILRTLPTSVTTIDEGRTLLARLESLRIESVPRAVAIASVMETILGALKRLGVLAKDLHEAFGAQCGEICEDIFAQGPLLKLR